MRGKTIILFIMLCIGLTECKTSVSEIGSDFFTNHSEFDIATIDTISVKVSTILRDSMLTSNTQRLLVGFHDDEKLGPLHCEGVLQLLGCGPINPPKATTQYVGISLFLRKDGYSFYDTTQTQTINVFQLSSRLASPFGFYYNQSKFTYDKSSPLGSLTFEPRPGRRKTDHLRDTLEVPLSDAVGQQLFTMAQEGDIRVSTSSEFNKFFRGLCIIPDSTASRTIMGFNSRAEMRVYYNDYTSTPTVQRHLTFGIQSYFSKVRSDRSVTKLNSLKETNDEVFSPVTDHEGYFQGGTGLAMRVELPYLHTLRFTDPTFVCTKAVLEIVATKPSYTTDPLPPSLALYYINVQNNFLTNGALNVNLINDVEYGRNTLYSADITGFVNAQLPNFINVGNALLISIPDAAFRSTVQRLYFGDQQSTYRMRVRLFYLTLPNQQN